MEAKGWLASAEKTTGLTHRGIPVCPSCLSIMAQLEDKWPENITGRFYVDEQCIDCDLCRELAPSFFRRNDEQGYSYVYSQPESPEDIGDCQEALESCPVEAIGDLEEE